MPDPNTETRPLPHPTRVRPTTAFRTLLSWNLAQIGGLLPLIVVVQLLLASGIVIGFGLLIPDIDAPTALFLATGVPTVLLMTLGLVMVPQGVAQARLTGAFTYMRTLPVPRPLVFLADLTVWVLVCVPSVAIAVLVGRLRYDLRLTFDWPLLIAASLLVAVTAIAVGYAIAVTLKPMLAQLVSQVLVFFVLLFSPVTYPESQLPAWYQTVHDFLPVRPGADLIRAGLAGDTYQAGVQDLLVLVAWCAAGVAITLLAMVRRR